MKLNLKRGTIGIFILIVLGILLLLNQINQDTPHAIWGGLLLFVTAFLVIYTFISVEQKIPVREFVSSQKDRAPPIN